MTCSVYWQFAMEGERAKEGKTKRRPQRALEIKGHLPCLLSAVEDLMCSKDSLNIRAIAERRLRSVTRS